MLCLALPTLLLPGTQEASSGHQHVPCPSLILTPCLCPAHTLPCRIQEASPGPQHAPVSSPGRSRGPSQGVAPPAR
eukprot:959916-Pelagomonas_calceolata.AAC.2